MSDAQPKPEPDSLDQVRDELGNIVVAALREQVRDEIRRIVLAEYTYWSQAPAPDCEDPERATLLSIRVGACAAAANIMGALTGSPAPWHAQAQPQINLTSTEDVRDESHDPSRN